MKRKFILLATSLLLVLVWVSFPVSAAADPAVIAIIYVDANAGGDADGTTWTDAYNYLQDALADTQAGDEIWVAEGTYRPDEGAGQTAGDRGATFQLIDEVAVYGGFIGGELSRDERDWQANQTILSGDLEENDGADYTGKEENSYHVVTGDSVGDIAILDGFIITAGNADGPHPDSTGAGMYNYESSPTLTNCSFSGNMAEMGYGGGMYNTNSSPTLANCTFSGNVAGFGGGMYNDNNSAPSLEDCTFSGNGCPMGGGGGGICNMESSLTLTNCTFSDNYAEDGGGGINNRGGSLLLTNCTFSRNSTFIGGGGIDNSGNSTLTNCTFSENEARVGGGMYNSGDSSTLTNCTFNGNVAWSVGDGYGGGMYNSLGSPTLSNCAFSGNFADRSGGGMYNSGGNPMLTDCTFSNNSTDSGYGGGMCNTNSSPTLTNCSFIGNGALCGGGMYNDNNSGPSLEDCTFSDNSADSGGGMYNTYGSNPVLTNCTFNGNSANEYGGGMSNTDTSNPTLTNCTFSGNAATFDGSGMYDTDTSNPTLTNCTFSGNEGHGMSNVFSSPTLIDCFFSENAGLGMYNAESWPTLTNCTFSGNHGGGMFNGLSSPTLTNCTFLGNDFDGMYNSESSPTLTDCSFSGNHAGGMFNALSSPTLINCTFSDNSADSGGGMYNTFSSNPVLTNCIFSGNSANEYGGGMSNTDTSDPILTNCTFSDNMATLDGGGMYDTDTSNPTLTNCILWGNSDSGETDESAQIYTSSGTPVINYCCLQGWTGALGGMGNIGDDPLFVDADGPDDIAGTADDNLRLLAGSPCIDAGDNSAVPAGVTTDPDGAPRISDGDHDGNAVVDMGAYEGITYELTLAVNGNGTTSPSAGPHTYYEGTEVDILATPDPGWLFVNWTGDVATVADVNADTTTVTMNGDYTITANFDEIAEVTYDLTMAVNGIGTTSPSAGPHTYNEGTELYITATPGSGWQFVNWTGSVADINAASTTIVVDADKTVTANFIQITHDLTMSIDGSGSITPSTDTHTYNEGDVVDITATPDPEWQFINWTGDVATVADVNANITTVTMNGDYTITANFSEIPTTTYDLTMAVSGNGSTDPAAGVYTCSEGLVVPTTATPDSGWHFVQWTGDVATVADVNANITTVTMNGDYTITANFAINTFTLTYMAGPGGTLTGQASQKVNYDGDGTAIEAVASTGYHFVDWSDGSTDNPRTDTNVTSDISVTANFSEIPTTTYDLTMAVSGNGTTSPSAGPHTYNEGTVVDITATPDSGWKFVNWIGDVADPNTASTTVTMDGDKVVTANFTEIEVNILAQQTISPGSPAIVSSDDCRIVIRFPANSMDEEAAVTIKEESQDGIPPCPSGFKAGATCFSIEMTADLAPGKTVTIIVKYSDADLEACDRDPVKLTLSRYDEDIEEWIMLPTTVDTEAMTLTASTDRFSTWMIMASEALAGEASSEEGTALWIWLVSIFGGLAVLIAIGSAIVINKRKSSLWHRVYSRH